MKKITAVLLSFLICVSLCACAALSPLKTISYNDDCTELYYNGRTYIDYQNTNGKYRIDFDDPNCVKIATMPYGYFYILGAVTIYYGNDAANPDFITDSRTQSFYVREDISFGRDTELSVCDADEAFSFTLSEVTTGETIGYSHDQSNLFSELCNFFVTLEPYSFVKQWISIYESDGKLYLQDVWDSDYYAITDEFKDDIYRLDLNTFDYNIEKAP